MSGGSAGFRMMIALPRSAPPSANGLGRRLGELVDVGARARASRLRRNRGDDLAPDHATSGALDRIDHRDGRLAAARHHVDVRLVDVGVAVDHRNGEGADRGGGEVDHLLAVLLQDGVVPDVRASRGRVEHDLDGPVVRQLAQALDALVGRRHVEARGARESVGLRIDADHRAHFEGLRGSHHLDHQVGANVARADDRAGYLRHHACSFANAARTEPRPEIRAS